MTIRDDAGLGSAALAGLAVYEDASRQSGRTERVLAKLRPGDVFVTFCHNEARRVIERLRAMGISDVRVVSRKSLSGPGFDPRTSNGGVIHYDHTIILEMYREAIEDVRCRVAPTASTDKRFGSHARPLSLNDRDFQI